MRRKFVWNTNSGYIEKVNTVLYKYFYLDFYHYIYNYILLCLLMASPISYILVITNPIIFCRKYGMNVYGEFFASIFSIQFFTVKILYCILNSEDQTTNRNWKTELNTKHTVCLNWFLTCLFKASKIKSFNNLSISCLKWLDYFVYKN